MIIKLTPSSPLSRNTTLQVIKSGDALTINNVMFDFSPLGVDASLPAGAVACDVILAPVYRSGSELVVQLILPCWDDSPEAARFPLDITGPADGAIKLPGLEITDPQAAATGLIDWSQEITAEMKVAAAAEQLLAAAQAETARLRQVADSAIAPLQDAVDLEDATAEEDALLKLWKKYRVALSRLPEQEGYPVEIIWPSFPY
ncbi:tail fiber assembly protein [Pseudomonas sp. BT-42-2]|uniref:tail fiber assembly protein n=1 Tax=Pseudomonas sp. BT-42-2 TaxID=2986927 RepID=UPI0021F73671|nr:tail fiber assembly protein [Pseudomonas sp. BT-42-2]MCV9917822.1 tail fiber assembly protein [Pseudomonas sp. BT-42-2]